MLLSCAKCGQHAHIFEIVAADVDIEKNGVAVFVLFADQVIRSFRGWAPWLLAGRASDPRHPRPGSRVATPASAMRSIVSGFMQPSVGRQIDPEAFLRCVIDHLVRELGAKQDFSSHERENPASGRMQPVDRPPGNVFGHAGDAVVEGPAIVAIEIAFPFGEQIRDERMELAGQQARAKIWEHPPRMEW